MPLSEHEQRLLDQIERGLYAEDPKFAQTVQARDPRAHHKRRVIKAVLGFIAGVCILMAGVVVKNPVVGVVGFVVMLACCVWGLTSWKRMSGIGAEKNPSGDAPPSEDPGPEDSSKPSKFSFPQRQNRRPSRPSRPSRQGRAQRSNRGSFMERMEERWRRRREDGR